MKPGISYVHGVKDGRRRERDESITGLEADLGTSKRQTLAKDEPGKGRGRNQEWGT